MHSLTTYLLHYFVARSLFDALFGRGHVLVLLFVAGAALLILRRRRRAR